MEHEFKIDFELHISPIHRPIYNLSPLELQESKTQMDSMLEFRFIQLSQYPWGVPVLPVSKEDGSLQLCTDRQWLNKRQCRLDVFCQY